MSKKYKHLHRQGSIDQNGKISRGNKYQHLFFEQNVSSDFLEVLQEKRQLQDPKLTEEYKVKNDETLLHIINIIMNSDVLSPYQKEIVELRSQYTQNETGIKAGSHQSTIHKQIAWIQGCIAKYEATNALRDVTNSPARFIKELFLRDHPLYCFIQDLLDMEENNL